MNKINENTIKLLDYVKSKQTAFMIDATVYMTKYLDLTIMEAKQKSEGTLSTPEIIIWDDKYTSSKNDYIFSFERNSLDILYLPNNFLWWGEMYSYPFSRHFFESKIVFRYKDDFIIIDYDGYAMDIVLIPKNHITDLSDAKEGSIKEITEEQYLSFRSFINDLKDTMKGRHIPTQIITSVNNENIDNILADISKNFIDCEYVCTDNSVIFTFISEYEEARCNFVFESENKDYITAIKLLVEI